jgi:hypothetical protein
VNGVVTCDVVKGERQNYESVRKGKPLLGQIEDHRRFEARDCDLEYLSIQGMKPTNPTSFIPHKQPNNER